MHNQRLLAGWLFSAAADVARTFLMAFWRGRNAFAGRKPWALFLYISLQSTTRRAAMMTVFLFFM